METRKTFYEITGIENTSYEISVAYTNSRLPRPLRSGMFPSNLLKLRSLQENSKTDIECPR